MPHLYPVVIPGGQSIRGASLGFHAYSLRIDNLSNQWLQEQSTLAWVPPYALGTCIRMYGTAVALILNASPTGQPQLQPIAGEYASGFFSDEYRTEVAGVPVRQFTLVQTVSDLTEGPEPAFPPVGVCRIWADPNGVLHHVHSDGTDATLIDTSTVLGGALVGRMPNPTLAPNSVGSSQIQAGAVTSADMAAGAAAGNVGALGGALSGSLPNPALQYFAQSGASITVAGGGWQNLTSIAIGGAGTYLLILETEIQYSSGSGVFYLRACDQTAAEIDRAYVQVLAGGPAYQHLSKICLPWSFSGGATFYLQALADNTLSVVTPYARLIGVKLT